MAITRIKLQTILPYIEAGATILAPNLRIKDAILSQYLEAVDSGIALTPKIVPIDVFILQNWEVNGRRGITPCNELLLLTANEEFLLWNEIIEESLSEIPLLNPDETANAVAHSYQLGRQWLDADIFEKELSANSGIADVAVFSRWSNSFQKKCKELNRISLVDAIPIFVRLLQEDKLVIPDNLLLVNFYDPPPLYQRLFAAIPNSTELYTVSVAENSGPSSKHRLEFDNPKLELQSCAKWVKKTLNENPHAHIGIISSNKEAERESFELTLRHELYPDLMFFDNEKQSMFNATGNAVRLIDRPMIYDALLVLGLGKNQHDIEDLIRLLQSPFLVPWGDSNMESEIQARISLASYLRQRAQAKISSRELSFLIENEERPYNCKLFATQLLLLRIELRKVKARCSAQQWSQVFASMLNILDWPNLASTQARGRTFKQWQSLLSQFSKSSIVLPELDYGAALAKLRLLASQVPNRNLFDASLPVSFYTVNEAIGLEFDHICLLGLNDQQWPQPVNPSPFIPYAAQKAAAIPGSHSEVQLSNSRKLFALLLAATKSSVRASYFKTDGEQEYRASSVIQDFALENRGEELRILNPGAMEQLHSVSMETLNDSFLPLSGGEQIEGGVSIISDQSSCPFRAFAINRLQIEPEPSLESGLSKMARGSALHIALEHLYENIDSSNKLAADDLANTIEEASKKAVEYLIKRYRDTMTPGFQQIEQQRIEALLHRFIEVEKKRPAFKIIAREHSLQQRFKNLLLNIRIDRIDRLENETTALLDYKTGKYTASARSWLNERPEDMQLPLYHTMASNNEFEQVESVAIAHVNAEKIGYSGVVAADSFSPDIKPITKERWTDFDWDQLTHLWSEKVNQLSAGFNAGRCEVDPVNLGKTCTYCGLQSLCRIQELTDADFLADEASEE